MLANENVSEPKPAEDEDTPLSFTMEGYRGEPPSPLIPFFWSPGWNSVQSVNKYQQEIGGHLHGGDPGIRLLEPHVNGGPPYFHEVPDTFVPIPGHVHIMPLYSIFGSEELSMYTPGVAKHAADFGCLYLNPEDLAQWNITAGNWVTVEMDHHTCRLVATANHWMPRGLAGVNAGLPHSPVVDLPVLAKMQV